jgi:bifunctional DNA-binding transcriptional regulator/antitoxin component of YhaV-PrlF toxin-antitoxin module
MALVGKVRIPKAVIEKARLKERDSLEIEAVAEGLVELRRPAKLPTLAQLVGQSLPKIATARSRLVLKLGSCGLVCTKEAGVWSIANMIPFTRPTAGPLENELMTAH